MIPISLSGFSTNHGAVQRWVLTAAFRAQIRKYFNDFTNYKASPKHQDLLPSRIKKDQRDIQIVYDTINTLFINPFSEMDKWISLAYRLVSLHQKRSKIISLMPNTLEGKKKKKKKNLSTNALLTKQQIFLIGPTNKA